MNYPNQKDILRGIGDVAIGTGNPNFVPFGVAAKASTNPVPEEVIDGASEARRVAASKFRHLTNDTAHAADDIALKLNPNATFIDRAGNALSHGVDNVKVAAQDAYDWAELNPGKAAGIAAGVPIALAGSYYLYKKMKDRQNGGRK